MNIRYLKVMLAGLALLFIFGGCSLYAGFSVKQESSPDQAISGIAAKHPDETAKSEEQMLSRYNLVQNERR